MLGAHRVILEEHARLIVVHIRGALARIAELYGWRRRCRAGRGDANPVCCWGGGLQLLLVEPALGDRRAVPVACGTRRRCLEFVAVADCDVTAGPIKVQRLGGHLILLFWVTCREVHALVVRCKGGLLRGTFLDPGPRSGAQRIRTRHVLLPERIELRAVELPVTVEVNLNEQRFPHAV